MPFDSISLIVNGIFLAILLVVLIILVNLASRFNFYYGLPIQEKYKWRIVRFMLLLIALALLAAAFNVTWPLVMPLLIIGS